METKRDNLINGINTGQLLKTARKLKIVNASIIEQKSLLAKVEATRAETSKEYLLWTLNLERLLKLRHYLRTKITALVICDPFDAFLDKLFNWDEIKVAKPEKLPRTFKSYENFNDEMKTLGSHDE